MVLGTTVNSLQSDIPKGADSYSVAMGERLYWGARGGIGTGEGKMATGRFCISMVGAGKGSSFSREVNNAINEGKLACSHRSCIGNNVFNKANDILYHYTVSL